MFLCFGVVVSVGDVGEEIVNSKSLLIFVVQSSIHVQHGLQHARPPCSSTSPGICPSSCSLHQWCCPAIPSLMPPSPSALKLSQHQGLFWWAVCSHQMTKILELHLQHQSFQWIFRVDPLRLADLILLSKGLSGAFSRTSILWCSAFLMVQLSQLHVTTGKTIALTIQTFVGTVMSLLFFFFNYFFIL